MKIKNLIPFIALGLLVTGSASSAMAFEAQTSEKKQNIVIKLSHGTDDLHAVIMALKIGKMMQMKGAQSTLFFNLESVRLLDDRVPLNMSWGHTQDIGKLYDDVVKSGAKVLVCPHCSAVAGLSAKNLRPGAQIAAEESMAEMFLKADKVIDY